MTVNFQRQDSLPNPYAKHGRPISDNLEKETWVQLVPFAKESKF